MTVWELLRISRLFSNRYEHVLRALCFLVKLSAEVIFEEYKNLNEFLNVPIKSYLISYWKKLSTTFTFILFIILVELLSNLLKTMSNLRSIFVQWCLTGQFHSWSVLEICKTFFFFAVIFFSVITVFCLSFLYVW